MEIIEQILNECSEYVQILRKCPKNCFLVRGCKDYEIDIGKYSYSVEKREPRNTPIEIHNAINKHFYDTHQWDVRNGLFCYGVQQNFNTINDNSYGKAYLFFPCNDFKYAYDRNIFDLTGYYYDFAGDVEEFLNSLNYENSDLSEVISNVIMDDKSVEISINCKEYFLISVKHLEKFSSKIW